MKGFFEVLSIVFVTVGSVIGAGFISGRELVGFFGTENYFVPLLIMAVLLCFSLAVLFSLGRRYVTLRTLNGNIFTKSGGFDLAVYISSFISVSGLLAVLDQLWLGLGVLPKIPVLSIVTIIALSIVSRYGIKGVESVSLFLVPIIIIAVNTLIFINGKATFSFDGQVNLFSSMKSILYVAMNCFINLPAIVEVAGGKSKKSVCISAVLVSVLLFLQSLLILNTVTNAGGAVAQSAMPLYNALRQGKYAGVYSLCVLSAVISSVVSAYYPLYSVAKEKGGNYGVLVLGIGAFFFSRLGLKNIVDYVYPIVGAFGTLYLIKCIIFLVKVDKIGYGRRKITRRKSGRKSND